MKKITLILLSCFFVQLSSGQDILDSFREDTDDPERMNNAYHKEHHNTREKVLLKMPREADVMWAKKIWREIDLRQKINHPLYFPQEKRKGEHIIDRYNLFDVLYNASVGKDGRDGRTIRAFDNAEYDDEFQGAPMTRQELEEVVLGSWSEQGRALEGANGDDSIANGQIVRGEKYRQQAIRKEDIKKWLVKEQWFFDKQRSVMDVRIIGLCPVLDEREGKRLTGEEIKLFWFYFPECRRVLKNSLAFNLVKNAAENKTFEDIFIKRMFSSTVVKEENVYDRQIQDYMVGLDALLEAERIKTELFNIEHDLWEY